MKTSSSWLLSKLNLSDPISLRDHKKRGGLMLALLMFGIHPDATLAKEVDVPAANTLIGGSYAITNSTLDGGGGDGAGGSYRLESTIGQADIGNLTSARFHVQGGFWVQQGSAIAALFSDGFE